VKENIEMEKGLTKRAEIFYCYAHEDEELRNKLEKHLSALKRQGLISAWHDQVIQAGKEWRSEIDTHLNTAHIILLLISPDFIHSDYCWGVEMRRALERHKAGEAHVIPIILRRVDWEETPINALQVLPINGTPVTSWTNLDEAFWEVAKGIRDVVRTFLSPKTEEAKDLSTQHIGKEIVIDKQISQLSYQMINTKEAINLFHQLMQPNSQMQILRLMGEGKMGKSHLLTKVFPVLARQGYQARCAVVDLRNPVHTVSDILANASSQLGSRICDSYLAAYEALINRPLSPEKGEDAGYKNYHLTSSFVKELAKLNDSLLLLLFDSVSSATKRIQTWLTDILLTQVSQLRHARMVLAGRTLPVVHSSHAACCHTYQLRPVIDEEAYIDYCKSLKMRLGEQSIRDFAYACDYTPGIFADIVLPKFLS
jgi:hypothetical protein